LFTGKILDPDVAMFVLEIQIIGSVFNFRLSAQGIWGQGWVTFITYHSKSDGQEIYISFAVVSL